MGYIVALVSLLGVLNLVLTLLLARWARGHGEQHASPGPGRQLSSRLPAGTQIPDFTAHTVSGETRSLGDLTGARSLVGFFSVGCSPCHEQLTPFRRLANEAAGDGQVLAVVLAPATDQGSSSGFVRELDGIATILLQERGSPVQQAFAVKRWPSFFLLDEHGRVEASGAVADRLAAAQRA